MEIQKTINFPEINGELTVTKRTKGESFEWSFVGIIYQKGKQKIDKYIMNCGQCMEYFPIDIQRLWNKYHLNGMTAGTEKQDACLKAFMEKYPLWKYSYDGACAILQKAGLLVDDGYEYGSGWKFPANPNDKEINEFWESI